MFYYKYHFKIYNTVGVYKSLQNISTIKPVVSNKSITCQQLLNKLNTTNSLEQIKYYINLILTKLQCQKSILDEKANNYLADLI